MCKKKLRMSQNSDIPVIQGLWIGSELSVLEQLSLRSFLDLGHSFHLYVYEDVSGVPAGVELKDGNAILDRSLIFKYVDRNTYSGFANLFRYKLLYDRGGFWVDLDMICMKAFDFSQDFVFSTEGNRTIGCCVMKAPAGSPIMKHCYEAISSRGNLNEMKWGESGPIFFRQMVQDFNLTGFAVDTDVFCPVSYARTKDFVEKSTTELLIHAEPKVRAVHLWNEIWRLSNVDKNADYPENCFYEELKDRLLNT